MCRVRTTQLQDGKEMSTVPVTLTGKPLYSYAIMRYSLLGEDDAFSYSLLSCKRDPHSLTFKYKQLTEASKNLDLFFTLCVNYTVVPGFTVVLLSCTRVSSWQGLQRVLRDLKLGRNHTVKKSST